MDAVNHLVGRAVESPRYALPAARRCIAVVEREQTETFLESLLNTTQQWYHDREKVGLDSSHLELLLLLSKAT